MDLAALGFSIDSKGAVRAASNLDRMTSAAARAEDAVEDLGAASRKAGKPLADAASGMKAVGASGVSSTNGLRMAALQLGQVAQQGGVTGNYMQALSIQLPDLLLGFGTFGALAGVAAGALIPFMSNLGGSADEAERAKEATDNLAKSVADYISAAQEGQRTTADLAEEFGRYATEVQVTLQRLAELNFANTLDDVREVSDALADTFSEVYGHLDKIETFESRGSAPTALYKRLERLAETTGVATEDVIRLRDEFDALGSARGAEDLRVASQALSSELLEIYGSVEDIPPALRDVATAASNAEVDASRLLATSEDVADGLGRAAGQAFLMSDGIRSAAEAMELLRFSGDGNDLLPPGYGLGQDTGDGLSIWSGNLLPPKTTLSTYGQKKGGGGGGKSEAEKARDEALREAEQLYASTRTAAESYTLELERLNELQEGGYITADTYGRAVADVRDQFQQAALDATEFDDAVGSAFTDLITGASSAKEALSDLLGNLAQLAANSAWNSLMEGSTGGWMAAVGSMLGFANGAAFSGGKVIPFANGGVVSGPTMFPMRGATGLMGEAGAEAIMPLTRGSDGKLGVRAQGGGGFTYAPVINAPGASAEALEAVRQEIRRQGEELPARMSAFMREASVSGGNEAWL